ncbi:uncharacterized protein EI90DRAFT_3054852 [Cantharellus anzutake]|uniref:uncharacterized protein n=1 Tax=Cantharellus anzutake TaxID=1750568 RepID=UPI001904F341|nr:uncharacterized protein EI90DRAFT_3054852 [Cantharellus anzutake]KAF8332278.1 hypothetical protein EI90DRAFT_3054852 [Cantharellus anzutake]
MAVVCFLFWTELSLSVRLGLFLCLILGRSPTSVAGILDLLFLYPWRSIFRCECNSESQAPIGAHQIRCLVSAILFGCALPMLYERSIGTPKACRLLGEAT